MRLKSSPVSKLRRWLHWLLVYDAAKRRHSKVGPPELWMMKRDFQIQFLRGTGLEPQHYLLDLGCGTLRGGIPIIDFLQKGHYFGVEVRREVLDEGRKELREAKLEGKEPKLVAASDVASLDLKKKFGYIWAFAVLIHMEDTILYDALGFVQRHLEDDGCFYATVNISNKSDKSIGRLGFPVVHRSLGFYEEACSRHGLRVEDIGPLTDFGHNLPGKTIRKQAEQRMLEFRKA